MTKPVNDIKIRMKPMIKETFIYDKRSIRL